MQLPHLVRIVSLLVAASLSVEAYAARNPDVWTTGVAYAPDLHELVLLPAARAVALPAGKFTLARDQRFSRPYLKAIQPADYKLEWQETYASDCADLAAKSDAAEAKDPQREFKAMHWSDNGADFDPRWYPKRKSWRWGAVRYTEFCLDGTDLVVTVTVGSPTGEFDIATVNAVLKGFADAVGPGTPSLSMDVIGYVRGASNAPAFVHVFDLYPASLVPVAQACNAGAKTNCEALRAFAALQKSCDTRVRGDWGPEEVAIPESVPGCIAASKFSAKQKDYRVAALYMQRACDAGDADSCKDAVKLRKKAGL